MGVGVVLNEFATGILPGWEIRMNDLTARDCDSPVQGSTHQHSVEFARIQTSARRANSGEFAYRLIDAATRGFARPARLWLAWKSTALSCILLAAVLTALGA